MSDPHPSRDSAPGSGAGVSLLLVSGISGAGKGSALAALADLGFETVDNPPLSLVEAIADGYEIAGQRGERLAIGLDGRSLGFTPDRCIESLGALRRRKGFWTRLLFLECEDDILLQRFSETRRRHPRALGCAVEQALEREREALAPLRAAADVIIDTGALSLTDLRREIGARFGGVGGVAGPSITVSSFGFKRGAPRDADLLFDIRFLANPYWRPELRPLSGLDAPVRDFVTADPAFRETFDHLSRLILCALPHYEREGRSYLRIAVGCTGGRHRSVVVARALAERIREANYEPAVRHRDLHVRTPSRDRSDAALPA